MYSPNAQQVEINNFIGGLNVTKPPTDIDDDQSPDTQNIINNELQGINSRYGYTRYYSTAIGSLAVNGLFVYNTFNSSDFLIAYGTSLVHDAITTSTTLWAGLTSGTVRSFEMDGYSYFLDGTNYIYSDGSTATAVSGKIPTYMINVDANGANGAVYEELNYIQSAFKVTMNGNGSATAYYLPFGSLTTSFTPIVLVSNVTQTLSAASAGFSINYTSGIIGITTAASTGVGNVEITVAKEVYQASQIKGCTFCQTYGEGNNVFAFLAGNPGYPARINWCYPGDPTYFPSTSYADVGVTNDKMMGFLPHGGVLQLWKYRSIHSFNGTPPNHSITEMYVKNEGCIATDTLKAVDGYPTCLSQRGVVYLIQEGNGWDLKLLSEDINGVRGIRDGLITETDANKSAAFAEVFDNKYWLHINDKIYVYQFDLKHMGDNNKIVYPWQKWVTSNNPKCFAIKDNYLYFGGIGNFYKFDPAEINDDGVAVDAYWYSKKFEIEKSHDWIKWFLNIYFNFNTRLSMAFDADVSAYIDEVEIPLPINSFSLTYWNPNAFNPNQFIPNFIAQNFETRIPLHKKGKFLQFKVRNNALNSLFVLLSAKIDYMRDRKVR